MIIVNIKTNANEDLTFTIGGATERARITSSGDVQIGDGTVAAEAPLHVTAENSQGIYGNTVMDTYEALLYAGLIDDSNEKIYPCKNATNISSIFIAIAIGTDPKATAGAPILIIMPKKAAIIAGNPKFLTVSQLIFFFIKNHLNMLFKR